MRPKQFMDKHQEFTRISATWQGQDHWGVVFYKGNRPFINREFRGALRHDMELVIEYLRLIEEPLSMT